MRNLVKTSAMLCAMVVLLSGCNTNVSESIDVTEPTVTEIETQKEPGTEEAKPTETESTTVFVERGSIDYQQYLEVMRGLSTNNPNMVYSPVSLNTALYMYSGMIEQNESYDEIMGFINGIDYSAYGDIRDCETGVYTITNRVWTNSSQNLTFDRCSIPDSLIYPIDMSDSFMATREKDAFVNETTNGFIDSTPTVFGPNTLIDVMNIVYFKDIWACGDLSMTDEEITFHNYDGTTRDVNMMRYTSDIYYENETCYVVPMEYSTGMTFYAIYPKQGLENVSLTGIFDNAIDERAYIELPEFDTYVTLDIDKFASSIGLPNFSGCVPLYCSGMDEVGITQVARIRVDHAGTEAAAVTEITTKTTSAYSPRGIELTFDEPFYYMIEDCNGDIAFIGRTMTLNY